MAASDPGCRVYVGNLDWKVTWQQLKDHMRQVGQVVHADVMEEYSGRSKGCGIVEYASAKSAQKAAKELNDTLLGERLIFVREDRETEQPGKGKSGKGKGKSKNYDGYSSSYSGGYSTGKGKGKGKGQVALGWSAGGSWGNIAPLRVGPGDKGRLVYVGNLPFRTSWQDLKDSFKEYGEVIRVDIATDVNGYSKGYATVLYDKEEDAQSAIENMNETEFQGRNLLVHMDTLLCDDSKGKGKGQLVFGMSGGSWGNIAPLRVGPRDKGRLIYVGNLPFRSSWQDLKDSFKEYGEIIRVDIASDANGHSKGYATVLYDKEEDAERAIENLHESEFQGRKLIVHMDTLLCGDSSGDQQWRAVS